MPLNFDRLTFPQSYRNAAAIFCLCGAFVNPQHVVAQVVSSNNWGAENTRLNPSGNINNLPATIVEGGAIRGSNLFHSFQRFNLANGDRVYFSNPVGINTIFSRIIGGQSSSINGNLGVDGTASLFLLNPSGLIFGPDAQLDIRGSFLAGTARSVSFGSQGDFLVGSSAAPPLLTISPSALTFVANQAGITTQNSNLTVATSKSLTLLGKQIQINGGIVTAPGGRIELSGIQGDGVIGVQQTGDRFPSTTLTGIAADVSISNQAQIDLRGTGGGDFVARSNNFTLDGDNTSIQIGLTDNATVPNISSGKVEINADSTITIQNSATINSTIPATSSGKNGKILLRAQNINLLNGGRINSTLIGNGGGGLVSLKADTTRIDEVDANRQSSGIQTGIEDGATGNGADIQIQGGSLQISNGARVETDTDGIGNAGNIAFDLTGHFSSFGLSSARRSRSGLGTFVERGAMGDSGKITINAESVLFQDSAKVLTNVAGNGQGQPLEINTSGDVILDGAKPFPGSTPSGILSLLRDGAEGNSGDIKIRANSLIVKDGAAISTDATGKGNSGNVDVVVGDRVLFDGAAPTGFRSTIGTSVEKLFFPGFSFAGNANGQAGTIRVSGRTVQLTNGAYFASSLTDAPGAAGKIIINATDDVLISGTATTKAFSSSGSIDFDASAGLFTETSDDTTGPGGEIIINAPRLDLSNGALINSSTSSRGPGGNIILNVPDINILSGAQVRVTTVDTGRAGDILVHANGLLVSGRNPNFAPVVSTDFQPLIAESAILANTATDSTGSGGTLSINARDVIIQNQGRVSVSSQGSGIGGLLNITARSLQLKELATLTAETSNATGGNINLDLEEVLLLRKQSKISTTAGTAQASGDGGNLRINAPLIVALPNENSDITANAFSGQGGQVTIETLALFNLFPRTRDELAQALGTSDPTQLDPAQLASNDITAISQIDLTLSGDVRISQLQVDPTQSAARLPEELVDRTNQITQSLCRVTQESQFVLTGRGGLPTSPIVRQLTPMATWEDIRLSGAQQGGLEKQQVTATKTEQSRLVNPSDLPTEAQSWQRTSNGQVQLIAKINRPQGSWFISPACGVN